VIHTPNKAPEVERHSVSVWYDVPLDQPDWAECEERDDAAVEIIAGAESDHSGMLFGGPGHGQRDLEFDCDDEAAAQQLYDKLRAALPERFSVAREPAPWPGSEVAA
jgi:hypothetical protein